LKKWLAPIEKVPGTDRKSVWHRLKKWLAPIGKVPGTDWNAG
jgi:hypothetical protein